MLLLFQTAWEHQTSTELDGRMFLNESCFVKKLIR
jgi:hypothetical protein